MSEETEFVSGKLVTFKRQIKQSIVHVFEDYEGKQRTRSYEMIDWIYPILLGKTGVLFCGYGYNSITASENELLYTTVFKIPKTRIKVVTITSIPEIDKEEIAKEILEHLDIGNPFWIWMNRGGLSFVK